MIKRIQWAIAFTVMSLLIGAAPSVMAHNDGQAKGDRPSRDVHPDPVVIESPRPDRPHPEVGGRDRPDRPSPNAATTASSPANNAYKKAVAEWQQACRAYQAAVANLARFKDKYLDANGEPLSMWSAPSVRAGVRKLSDDVDSAAYDLSRAESARNAAFSRAAQEAVDAFKEHVAPAAPPSPTPRERHNPCGKC